MSGSNGHSNGNGKRVGRPPKVTPAQLEIVLDNVRLGLSWAKAALIAGLQKHDVDNWQRSSPEFYDALKKAEAEGEAFHLQRIRDAKTGWQASAWFLERKLPSEYSNRTITEHTGSVTVTHEAMFNAFHRRGQFAAQPN